MACREPEPPAEPLTVYAAASLAKPLAPLAAAYREETRIGTRLELGGSLELSRRMTDLGHAPDVLLLADDDVIAALMPAHFNWYVRFATSTIVVAYTPRSKGADSITSENWWRVLSTPTVTIGRADSAIAPAGRHALRLIHKLSSYYASAGLGERLLERASARYMRSNAAELAALLEAGEVDYIFEYESVAKQYGFRYVRLPADLAPSVLYGATVPLASARRAEAVKYVAFLVGPAGRRLLRESDVEVLRLPVAIGTDVPPEIADVVRVMAAGPGEPR